MYLAILLKLNNYKYLLKSPIFWKGDNVISYYYLENKQNTALY